MTRKIFSSTMLVAGIVLLAAVVIIIGVLYEYFGGVQTNELRDELGARRGRRGSGRDGLS